MSEASSSDPLRPPDRSGWSSQAQVDSDPHAPLPGIDREFPGVMRWFELRRRANQTREHAALEAFTSLEPGLVSDIPIAGADWPYGQPVDVDLLHRLAAEHRIGAVDFRVNAIPDPPGTVLRLRRAPTPARSTSPARSASPLASTRPRRVWRPARPRLSPRSARTLRAVRCTCAGWGRSPRPVSPGPLLRTPSRS